MWTEKVFDKRPHTALYLCSQRLSCMKVIVYLWFFFSWDGHSYWMKLLKLFAITDIIKHIHTFWIELTEAKCLNTHHHLYYRNVYMQFFRPFSSCNSFSLKMICIRMIPWTQTQKCNAMEMTILNVSDRWPLFYSLSAYFACHHTLFNVCSQMIKRIKCKSLNLILQIKKCDGVR